MRILTLIGLLCFCFNVNAETIKLDLKTGLWENSFKIKGDGANEIKAMQTEQMKKAMEEMKKQLANMPAEQRKQMEAMMAQSGMNIDTSELGSQVEKVLSQGTKSQQCIVDTEFDPKDFLDAEEGENCKSTLTQVSKNKLHSTQVCTGENASQHEMDIVFDSPKHYIGTGVSTQSVSGKAHKIEIILEGTWLSSDCGNVKPDQK